MTAERDTPVLRTFDPGDHPAIAAIVERTFAAGDLPGRAHFDVRRFLEVLPGESAGTIVAEVGGEIVGFTAPSWQELIVHPDHRRRGHGTRLVAAALADAGARGQSTLTLAPPPGSNLAVAFLTRLGFAYDHSLWRLRLAPDTEVPPPDFPPDIVARHFRRDENLAAYVDLVNAAFADHPSPYAVTIERVRHSHGLPDFDPANILLLAPKSNPGRPVAVCRCALRDHAGRPIGIIGLIGVLPAWRGRGLGRELLRWGVARLRAAGATEITLTVDADNDRALALYVRTGFVRTQEWPRWSKPIPTAAP